MAKVFKNLQEMLAYARHKDAPSKLKEVAEKKEEPKEEPEKKEEPKEEPKKKATKSKKK